jgi:hypothetical protein
MYCTQAPEKFENEVGRFEPMLLLGIGLSQANPGIKKGSGW